MLRSGAIVLLLIAFGVIINIGGVDAGRKSSSGSSRVAKAPACGEKEYRCDNGACIPDVNHCNGAKDCTDGSDEVGCGK